MPVINEHIILEITKYLDILDLLSLAHSCSVAFHASQLYSFWRPHEFDASNGLSAFLPSDRIGPWRSYNGDDIRAAATRMLRFKKNWSSENPQAICRVNLGQHPFKLTGIPGTRWLYYHFAHYSLTRVAFIDGKTGIRTRKEIEITLIPNLFGLVIHPLGPNEVLLGASCGTSFEVFRVYLSVCRDTEGYFIETDKMLVQLWREIPRHSITTFSSKFLAIMGKAPHSLGEELNIFHIQSGRHWKWLPIDPHSYEFLLENWCFMLSSSSGHIQIVVIQLPSLLLLPESADTALVAPKGHVISDPLFLGNDPLRYTSPQIYVNDHGYTILYSIFDSQVAFDIHVEHTPGDIYANVVYNRTRESQFAAASLKRDVIDRHNLHIRHVPRTKKLIFGTSEFGFTSLVIGYSYPSLSGALHTIEALYWADTREDRHTRRLSWKELKKNSPNITMEENDQLDHFGPINGVECCDASIGVVILKHAGDSTVFYALWF